MGPGTVWRRGSKSRRGQSTDAVCIISTDAVCILLNLSYGQAQVPADADRTTAIGKYPQHIRAVSIRAQIIGIPTQHTGVPIGMPAAVGDRSLASPLSTSTPRRAESPEHAKAHSPYSVYTYSVHSYATLGHAKARSPRPRHARARA